MRKHFSSLLSNEIEQNTWKSTQNTVVILKATYNEILPDKCPLKDVDFLMYILPWGNSEFCFPSSRLP